MKRTALIISVTVLLFIFPALALIIRKYVAISMISIPRWSIGLYEVSGNLEIDDLSSNPVFSASNIQNSNDFFVADPFVMKKDSLYYMFYEKGLITEDGWRGVINVASSKDASNWVDRGTVLQDQVSLSFPTVTYFKGWYYMTVEGSGADNLRLFASTSFPYNWSCVDTLLTGKWSDPVIVFEDETYFLFVSKPGIHDAYLFFSENIIGPYIQHPASPIVENDSRTGRNAGTVFKYRNKTYRPVQDCSKLYGKQVRMMEILELSRTGYNEIELNTSPVLTPDGKGWNAKKMHTFNTFDIGTNGFKVITDGTPVDYEHQIRLTQKLRQD